jgi:hypothetical protein
VFDTEGKIENHNVQPLSFFRPKDH